MYELMNATKNMYDVLIPVQYACLVVMCVEGWIVFRKSTSRVHMCLFFNIVVNFVNSAGYLFELKAHSSEGYLTALKLSYIGRVWVAFSLFLFITELCRIKIPMPVKIGLALFHIGSYIAVLTIRKNDLFYKDIDFIYIDGYIRMNRSSGIVHKLQSISIIAYILFILTVLLITMHRETNKRTKKCLITVTIAMIVEAIFTIIQVFVPTPITYIYDLTMPGFVIGTVIMLIAIFRFDLLGAEQLAKDYMIDRLSESIIAVDNRSKVRYFNDHAKELYPGLKLSSDTVPKEITDALEVCGTITKNDRIYKPEQTELMHGGERVGTLYSLVDETEHFRYMEVLEEQKMLADSANKAKSAFLANMSHDIRTPINAVLGMNEMILRECEDGQILDYSGKIRSAGNTLLGLINDILDFSKIEAGKLDIIPVDYDLMSMLNDLVNMIQPRADAKGLKFTTEIDENTPSLLHGDEIRLKQIITNILTNAVKYTEKGAVTFTVRSEKHGENGVILNIAVSDTGIGIKQEDIPRLFSEFDRIEEERNRAIEGTGLGMSITRRLLALMNSKLEVQSEYGRGSVFSFAVEQGVVKWDPVGSLDEALRRTLDSRRKYHEKFTAPDAQILVVDDTPMNLEVFVSLLKRTLIRIDTADGCDKCIELAVKKKYDVIFLDHMMPGKDGLETLKELKALNDSPNADTPVICLTANAVSGSRDKYINAGFDDYLSKPIDPDRIEELLISWLPKDKVKTAAADDTPDGPEVKIPEFVREISEIDADEGIRHCGGTETYMLSITTYAGTVSAAADEAENLLKSGDIHGATVKIHALKSTSRVIGAMELGALAEELEAAGNANDTEKLNARADELFTRCRALGEQLSPLLKNDDLQMISDDELNEAYTLIREFLSVDDLESVMQIIGGLDGYSFPDSEKQRCEALKKAAREFDYDAMKNIMGD